jgi:glycosyltransferase involved in cell wall biosynthesis
MAGAPGTPPVAGPWLTVIIPSYRGETWIDSALSSLAAEPTGGIEVFVIDSSPTSATRDIAQSYLGRLNIQVFERGDLSSWHTKTNFGVERARSPHICWLGVDDVWLPGRVAAMRKWIEGEPLAVLHLAPCAVIDANGKTRGVWRCPVPTIGEVKSTLLLERLLVQNFIAAPAPVFRRDAWLKCGGLDASLWYTADWDIWVKLAATGSVHHHREVTIGFRIHGASLTMSGSRNIGDFVQQMQIVLERHLPKIDRRSNGVERAARASICVNSALASAFAGDMSQLPKAAFNVLRLGPVGVHRYLRDSRIFDRVMPRVRAQLAGGF